jgi:hypothetical protein
MSIIKDRTLERQWLERRQCGIGSSDSPVIVLGGVYDTRSIDTYLSKVNPIGEREDNPHFRRGHFYEPLALALSEQQTGIKVYAPETDVERYINYQCWDPDRPWMFSDFDGVMEDGWIAEVKAPMQRVADRIASEGIEDYHLVQSHHHNHIANVAERIPVGPGCFTDRWRGKIKGTRLIVFEVEKVQIQVYEIPYDQAFIGDLLERCRCFWEDHVVPRKPPYQMVQPPKKVKKQGGKYTLVEGDAWDEAAHKLAFAKQMKAAAERRLEDAKQTIKEAMRAAEYERIMLPDGNKFQLGMQTRRSLDIARILVDYPGFLIDAYKVTGKPYEVFRHYGGAEVVDGAEGDINSLREQLDAYADRDMDAELAASEYDRLRDQAEWYNQHLKDELQGLNDGMLNAYTACMRKLKGV